MSSKVLELIGDLGQLEREVARRLGPATSPSNVEQMTLAVATEKVRDGIAPEFARLLQEALDTHIALSGDRVGGGSDPDDWDSELDEAVLEALTPFQDVLGAGFLGGKSVDTQLHGEGEVEKLAREFASHYGRELVNFNAEYVKSLVNITPASAAPGATADLAAARAVAIIVVGTYIRNAQTAGLYDELQLIEELDLASQEDEGLAVGAIERLAPDYVNKDDIRQFLRSIRVAEGGDWDTRIIAEAEVAGQPSATTAAPTEKPKKTRRKKGDPVAPESVAAPAAAAELSDEDAAFLAELEGDTADPTPAPVAPTATTSASATTATGAALTAEQAKAIVTTCKEVLPMAERELAELFGFSRSTLNNIVTGKKELEIDELMRQRVLDAVNAQSARLAEIAELLS